MSAETKTIKPGIVVISFRCERIDDYEFIQMIGNKLAGIYQVNSKGELLFLGNFDPSLPASQRQVWANPVPNGMAVSDWPKRGQEALKALAKWEKEINCESFNLTAFETHYFGMLGEIDEEKAFE